MCVIVSLWSLCGISLFYSQRGGAIYNHNSGDLTFEGSATFTSCSAEASTSSSSSFDAYAVSGGEGLSIEAHPTYCGSFALTVKSCLICR